MTQAGCSFLFLLPTFPNTPEKNIHLVTTNLTDRQADDIMADFEFSENGQKVLRCPGGIFQRAVVIMPQPVSAQCRSTS